MTTLAGTWIGRLWAAVGICFLFSAAAQADCALMEEADKVGLENDFVKLTFQVDKGACLTSLLYKTTQEQLAGEWGGMQDRVWIGGGQGDFYGNPYSYRVAENDPRQARVVFFAKGHSPGWTDLLVERTITLTAGKSSVDVNVKFTNQGKNVIPIGLWVFQDFKIAGKKNTFYSPTAHGVGAVAHYPLPNGKFEYKGGGLVGADRFIYDFTRGWNGVVAETGTGVVGIMRPEQVSCLYNWFSAAAKGTTLEWIYNGFEILPGKERGGTPLPSWETQYTVLPLVKFGSLDGAGGDAAGGISLDAAQVGQPAPVRVQLLSGEGRTADIAFLTRRLPDGQFVTIASKTAELHADRPADVPFEFTPREPGTHVLRFEVRDGARLLFDMERPVVVGAASGEYTQERNFVSIGTEMKQYQSAAIMTIEQTVNEYDGRAYLGRKLSREYVTPHIPWGVPYSKGPVKILASVPLVRSCSVRQIIELAERLDVDFDVVLDRPASFKDGRVCAYEEDEWARKLKGDYDALVMNSRAWPALTDELRAAILKKVEGGMGLVFVGRDWMVNREADPLLKLAASAQAVAPNGRERRGIPLPGVPSLVLTAEVPMDLLSGEIDDLRTAAHGKGKIVFVSYSGPQEQGGLVPGQISEAKPLEVQGCPLDDYRYSLLAKLVLLAAGKQPGASIAILTPATVSSEEFARTPIAASLRSAEGFSGKLELTVRDRFNNVRIAHRQDVQVQNGETQLGLPSGTLREREARYTAAGYTAPLAAGLHVVDIQLRDGAGKAVAWASKSLMVTMPVRLSALAVPRNYAHDGDAIEANATIEADADAPGPFALSWELMDNLGRLMWRDETPLGALLKGKREAPAGTKLTWPLTNVVWLIARLRQGDKVLDEQRQEIFTCPKDEAAFYFLDCAEFSRKRTKELGFNGVLYENMESLRLNMAGYAWNGPNIYVNFDGFAEATGLIRNPCLSDPKFRQQARNEIQPLVENNRIFNRLGEVFAAEWRYGGRTTDESALCHSPTCLSLFRDVLEKKYGNIAALNSAWNAERRGIPLPHYQTFAEIEPPLPAEIQKRIAKVKAGERSSERRGIPGSGTPRLSLPAPLGEPQNFTDWIDHHLSIETEVADFMQFCNQEAADGKLRMGLRGMLTNGGSAFIGLDFWKLVGLGKMPTVSTGGDTEMEILRSFKRPGQFFANTGGGYDTSGADEKRHRSGAWNLLYHGSDACVYGFFAPAFTCLYPDLSYRPAAGYIADTIALIGKGGIGRLIRKSTRLSDGIAIHYSQASIHANRLLGMIKGGVPTMDADWDSWLGVLKTLGLQANFVSYDQIEQGKLAEYKLLIMPFSHVLSPREKQKIEEFVGGGGTVIADVLSPDFTRMCNGADVQDLFGIEEKGLPALQYATLKTGPGSGLNVMQGSASLAVKAGQTQSAFENGVPAVIVKPLGQGRTIFLNMAIADYSEARPEGDGVATLARARAEKKEGIEKIVSSLLALAGIEPAVKVTEAATERGGIPLPGKPLRVEIIRYRDGNVEYVALYSLSSGSGLITEKDHLRARISLGRKAHIYSVIDKQRGGTPLPNYLGEKDETEFVYVDGEPTLFALLPAAATRIDVEVNREYRPGELMQAAVTVTPPYSGVVIVALAGEDGTERYRREVAVTDGKGLLQVPFALNDSGKWRLTAVDVATGIKAEEEIVLRAK